jgi:hypothetical protein
MGLDIDATENGKSPFSIVNVKNRQLVLEMLAYEDGIIHDERGYAIYRGLGEDARTSLVAEKSIQRIVLNQFGFDTSDESVAMYGKIFAHYYKSPTNYDKDVMNAVTYFRVNKCIFYTSPIISIGDVIPDCVVLEMDGKTETSVYNTLELGESYDYAFVAGFSTS